MINARVQEVLGGQLGFQSEPFALSARRWLQIVLLCVSVPRLLKVQRLTFCMLFTKLTKTCTIEITDSINIYHALTAYLVAS